MNTSEDIKIYSLNVMHGSHKLKYNLQNCHILEKYLDEKNRINELFENIKLLFSNNLFTRSSR